MFQTTAELTKWKEAKQIAVSAWYHEGVLVTLSWKHSEIAFFEMSDSEGVLCTGYATLFDGNLCVATIETSAFGSRATKLRRALIDMNAKADEWKGGCKTAGEAN